MKNQLTILSLLILSVFSTSLFAGEKMEIDTKESHIHWVGKKVTGQHSGDIFLKSGYLISDRGGLGGEFIIDMASLIVTDIEGKSKEKLEGHLKNEDFFATAKYPTAKFTITSGKQLDRKSKTANYQIEGNLEIKGISNKISFPAMVDLSGEGFTAKAKFTIDRTKWDIKYGSGSFFDDLGDKTIYDDIELELNLSSKTASNTALTAIDSDSETNTETEIDPVSYSILANSSSLNWTGTKLGGEHTGTINIKSGTTSVMGDQIGGNFIIDMKTIVCTDLSGKTADKLVGHLNSHDFFAVAVYPEATLQITGSSVLTKNDDGNTHTLKADLTIKGNTNEISFPAKITTSEIGFSAEADITIDRTKWEIRYGSGSFFANLGDKVIHDEITFKVNLTSY